MSGLAVLSEQETIRQPVFANASTLATTFPLTGVEVPMVDFREWLGRATSRALTSGAAVAPDEAEAEWKNTVEKQVGDLAALQAGWDSYAAPAIDPNVISDTKLFVTRIAKPGIPAPAVVPTVNGTIQLEWHTRSSDAEVEILEPGHYHVFISVVAEQPWEGEVTLNEAVLRIQQRLAR